MRAIEEYLAAKAFAPAVEKMYHRTLAQVDEYLRPEGLLEAPQACLVAWFASLKESIGEATRRHRLSHVRSFYRYALLRDWLTADPTRGIQSPRAITNQVPTFLTADQQRRLLEAPDKRTIRGRQDAAMLGILAHGLRLAELVGLNTRDLHAPSRGRAAWLKVRGKGNKERVVRLTVSGTYDLLRRYREKLPLWQQDTPALFPGEIAERISPSTVQRRFKRYAVKVGVDLEVAHPHAFRHGMATRLVEGGCDLETVRQALGHSSIATTQKYLHINGQHTERELAVKDPLNGRRRGKVLALFPGVAATTSKT